MFELTTDRLLLRPVRQEDAEDIERVIFTDPEVVKGLAHDGSDPNVRRTHSSNWSKFGPDGKYKFWDECKTGLYAISDRTGSVASPGQFIGITGVYLEEENEKWTGELFYALGSPFHGKGIMSEACDLVVTHFKSVPNAGSLYAVYWQVLNPASGRILEKLNFVRDGTHSILEEYDEETASGIRHFELWRLANSTNEDLPRITQEVAIKLGHLEREGISSETENQRDICKAIGDKTLAETLEKKIERFLETGRNTPGLAMMRLFV